MRGGERSVWIPGRLVRYGTLVLAAAISACTMPTLDDRPRSLLTAPPGSGERASEIAQQEPAMALQAKTNLTPESQNDILVSASAPPSLDDRPQPVIPADGIMRGEFAGSSLAFADADGLVCAGRLLGRNERLDTGMSVPVNCSDGSAGRVKITEFTTADEARGQLSLANDRRSPVLLARSADLE